MSLDSPRTRRSDAADARGLESLVERLAPAITALRDARPE
jgi:hypothetical protein